MMRMSTALIVVAGVLSALPAAAQDQAPELTVPQNRAAKLAGLAGFVNMSCPEIQTEKDRFRTAIEALRINPADLEHGKMRLSAESYIMAYQKDVPASCRQAGELFGRNGSVIPGLFVSR
ncbi:hypothetical protein [Methylobacterium sp. J-068]|uniref:hypothetical protein n=1 Tax=Methylobacterium sp. J-068 TaxID=2836649 RepID=UPI001FB9E4FA|nr:hypothetical protein [Methylobacterium sp. J-068]MCJ2035648.1 hypothetical protein [Methylobacterium sp. J-068]